MQVSLIMTVYNERQSMPRLLDSLAHQSRRPDEIVICDGGSDDGTVAFIEQYARQHADSLPPIHVLVESGANISRGRNVAIRAAHGPIIAATDAGVHLSADWLEQLVGPFDVPATSGAEMPIAVAGFFKADAGGTFQTAMAATVLPLRDEINPDTFLPSSRSVAFTKSAWQAAGGYPEWLDYCEDLIFDFGINEQQSPAPTGFAWAPKAVVHFRPRENLRAFWTQYFRYARGDGKADLWRKRHAIRYGIYLVAIPALLGHAFFGFFARWMGWLGLLTGVMLYCWRPWQRLNVLGQDLSATARVQAMLLVPIIRAVGDVAKMAGYPIGLWWRWQNRGRTEIQWRKD